MDFTSVSVVRTVNGRCCRSTTSTSSVINSAPHLSACTMPEIQIEGHCASIHIKSSRMQYPDARKAPSNRLFIGISNQFTSELDVFTFEPRRAIASRVQSVKLLCVIVVVRYNVDTLWGLADLLSHLVHEIRASDALWKAWEIFNFCGCHELAASHAACLIALKHQRPYICSSSIDCCCVPADRQGYNQNDFRCTLSRIQPYRRCG